MVEIRYCTAKYGFEDSGRTAFADTGSARLAWNKLVKRAWEENQSQWFAIYVPSKTNGYRQERGREPVDLRYLKKIGAVQEVPPPPKPHIWSNFAIDRWPMGVPTGQKLVLNNPIDINQYIEPSEFRKFMAAMEQSSLYQIEGTELAKIIQNLVDSYDFKPAPVAEW